MPMPPRRARLPERIVCLTEETTETLYLLGEQHRIVGISGYTVRPPQARREKPKISAFTSAKIDKILSLSPDLVLGFSDLQAEIARTLIQHGVSVFIFNQRSVDGILDMILTLGHLVGANDRAQTLLESLMRGLAPAPAAQHRPVVYFEEWDQPMISGIRWVAELIDIAGGIEAFPDRARAPDARGRIIADPAEVVARRPDIIIGSWCGKRFQAESVCARPGWDAIPAVRDGELYEIKSSDILQPGPAALTDGLSALRRIIADWHARRG